MWGIGRAHPIYAGLALGLGVLALVGGAWRAGWFVPIELLAYDEALRRRQARAGHDAGDVAIIGLTEQDLRQFGWPLSDFTLAGLLEWLAGSGARLIGLDLYRDLPEPRTGEELHRLESVMLTRPQVIAIYNLDANTPPPPVLANCARRIGFNDLPADGAFYRIVRRGLLFMDDGNETVASFAYQLARTCLESEGILPRPDSIVPEHLCLGKARFRPLERNDGAYVDADAGGYQFLLDCKGPAKFPTFSLNAIESGACDPEWFRDRVVLVGVTADSVHDLVATPIPSIRYGVELHAHIVDQLLRAARAGDDPLRFMPEWLEAIWIAVWGAVGALIGYGVRSPWHWGAAVATGGCGLGAAFWGAFQAGWWIPVMVPAFGFVPAAALFSAYRACREKQQRRMLMELFGRHVSPQVAQMLWCRREQLLRQCRDQTESLSATILFSDLKGFTTVCERLDPALLSRWLNRYFERMVEVIVRNGGTVNKFIGDAVMVVFGFPFAKPCGDVETHAAQAVDCALEMGEVLEELNCHWRRECLPEASMRIGIFTGEVMAGCVGGVQRMEFTVLGDVVNTAARLESLERQIADPDLLSPRCRILIGEPTKALLPDRFHWAEIGAVQVKGKTVPVTVYQVIGRKE